MEKYPEDAMAAALAREQSVWAQRVRDGLHGARRDLDGHDGNDSSCDLEGYAVIVRALQRADEVLSAMRPGGR
jgi:hypothetical protein